MPPRPGVAVACDPVIVSSSDSGDLGDGSYATVEQGVGCTTGREFARRWNASRTCRALATGASCAIAGGECQAIAGGRFRALASARCSPPSKPTRTVELVQYLPCVAPKTHADTFRLWAINLPCQNAMAFPIDELGLVDYSGQDAGAACAPPPALEVGEHKTCRPLAGFTCTVTVRDFGPVAEGFRGRCREHENPFHELRFDYILG